MVPAAQLGLLVENIGVGELVVIAFLALVVLGPDRIPEMARSAGRLLNNAKKFTSNLSGDMQDVINDPAMQPIRELGEFATRPRQKLAEYALEAEAEERQRLADETVRSNVPSSEAGSHPVEENGPQGSEEEASEDTPASAPDDVADTATDSGPAEGANTEPDADTPESDDPTP